MNTLLTDLIETRLFIDAKLLASEKPLIELAALIVSGLVLGLCIARCLWYRVSEPQPRPAPSRIIPQLKPEFLMPPIASNKAGPRRKKDRVKFIFSPDGDEPVIEEGRPSRRTIYLMDVSQSLSDTQMDRCKGDLTEAILDLPLADSYQVIFFSGAAWFAHQKMIEGGAINEVVVIADGEDEYHWQPYNFGNQFKFKDGVENLPQGFWLSANAENKQRTIEQVNQVEMSIGTTWHMPFMLAMKLDPAPDHIYFLTDGRTANQDVVASGIIELVEQIGNDTVVSTRGLGTSIDVDHHLERISEKTGGEFASV